ncbi:hypothetical protein [Desulfopila inferna]|uniref:hypothetical protein n=1 Tax=Desulfopila inferna TaxID=468528 RepID=UPI00196695DC|nr:hypothetical protein [Desulfopila inferna]MBM9606479.1 hypothetical protein [Desulfopila inferna]
MKNLTAEQILKKTFKHLEEMVDEKGEERRNREGNGRNVFDGERNSKQHDSWKCTAGEENNEKNE